MPVMLPLISMAQPEIKQLTYMSELAEGFSTTIKLIGNDYFLESDGQLSPLRKGAVIFRRGDEVLFMDVDQDGIKDIFVKFMDARAEGIYILYMASVSEGKLYLKERPEIFGSPYLDGEILISVRHNGPYSHVEKYKASSGLLYRFESRDPINPDMEKVVLYDRYNVPTHESIKLLGLEIDATGCISTSKTTVHKQPGEEIENGHLILGDVISVRDATKNGGWFKVYFQRNNTEGWIRGGQFDVDCNTPQIQPISAALHIFQAHLKDVNGDGIDELLIPKPYSSDRYGCSRVYTKDIENDRWRIAGMKGEEFCKNAQPTDSPRVSPAPIDLETER